MVRPTMYYVSVDVFQGNIRYRFPLLNEGSLAVYLLSMFLLYLRYIEYFCVFLAL